ncbi:hypothetical protein ACJZTR_01575 [Neorickettsia risticii]|uniref:DNA polymerase III subunit delta n=1 Tax=Neorickettsia risticii (strain Illinois) TaxID=434131 RepID=C6V4N1_NEORI|nr:hypothetical protein [Neorickettsia risticii]ACT69321.1 conserved hypothetical protein [Neorickettsia risticii str. Illinois]
MYKAQKKVLLSGYQKSRAWLLTGPSLDDMFEIAIRYAKWILKSDEAIGDLMIIQERSIKVAHVQRIHDFLNLTSNFSNQKIIIMSHFEIITSGAANALLKVLEEGKQTATLILIARYSQQITNTVRSRCFHLYFPLFKKSTEIDKLIVQYRNLLEKSVEEEAKDSLPTLDTLGQDLTTQFQMTQKFSEASLKDLLCFTFNRIIKFHHGVLEKESFFGERILLGKLGQSAIFWHNRWLQISEVLSTPEELYIEKKHLLRIALTTREI